MTVEQNLYRIARQHFGTDAQTAIKYTVLEKVSLQQIYSALLAAYQLGYRDHCKQEPTTLLDTMG